MRLAFRRVVTVLAVLMALGVAEMVACPNVEASFGVKDALSTIGIAAGIGTVMGLSTIAFYDSPTAHLGNALVGAGAGLIVGLGVAAYLMAADPESDEINPEDLLPLENQPNGSGKKPGKDPGKVEKMDQGFRRQPSLMSPLLFASAPSALALRGTSNWMVAVKVLELRF